MEDLARRQIADKFGKFKEDILRTHGVEISDKWLADKIEVELLASIDREFKGRFHGASGPHLADCKKFLAEPPEPTIQDLPESKSVEIFSEPNLLTTALKSTGKIKKPSKSK